MIFLVLERDPHPGSGCGRRRQALRALGARREGAIGAAHPPRPAGRRRHPLRQLGCDPTRVVPPRLRLDAGPSARDLHHARTDRTPGRPGRPEADRPAVGALADLCGIARGRSGGGKAEPESVLAGHLRGEGHPVHRRWLCTGRRGAGAQVLRPGRPLQTRHVVRRLCLTRRPHGDRAHLHQHQPALAAAAEASEQSATRPPPSASASWACAISPGWPRVRPDCSTPWLSSRCWWRWCWPTSEPS